jgi:glycosyltransferase involved in cell wall biosynthesis
MRVLIITGSYPPMKCGVGDYTALLAKHLSEVDGIAKVGVLTDTAAKIVNLQEDNVELLPYIKGWGFSQLRHIINRVLNWSPDIVHIQYPTMGYGRSMMPSFLPFFLRRFRIKVIQTWHEPLSQKGLVRYLPNACTRDDLIVVEPYYKSFLPSWYSWILSRQKRMHHIPISSNIPRSTITDTELRDLRENYDAINKPLITYFGFVTPQKGVDHIFEILNPNDDFRLVLMCELNHQDPHHRLLLETINKPEWKQKVSVAGFLDQEAVANLLKASDAVVLPFVKGVSYRNGSFLAACLQGTFVLTTHFEKDGYDANEHVYYTKPVDIQAMKLGLNEYLGTKKTTEAALWDWTSIAYKHKELYTKLKSKITNKVDESFYG